MYFKEWIKRGIILVSDLYNHEGEFMSMDEIKCAFENGGSACLKYLALNQAIPRMWKRYQTLIVHTLVYGLNLVKTQ